MQTTDLTLNQLLGMKPYENDNEKLKKIRADLSRNASSTDGREQDPTVAYALKLLERVILFNNAIRTFTQHHMVRLAYFFNSARPELTELIRTTTDKEIMSIDLEKINITHDKAKLAALAICHLIRLHNTPEPFKDQRLTDKIKAIETKIIQYEFRIRARREQIMALEIERDTSSESLADDDLTSGGSILTTSVWSETASIEERNCLDVELDPADGSSSLVFFSELHEPFSSFNEGQANNIHPVPLDPLPKRSCTSHALVVNGFKITPQPVAREPLGALACITEFLRCFFYVLDVLLTATLWMLTGCFLGKETMNDTYNPLGKAFTGRSHFFVCPLTPLATEANGLERSILYQNKPERALPFVAKI